jgi:hypothetical protein
MKKIFTILFFTAGIYYAQIGYVEYDHKVYDFLERMSSFHLIENYNSFELPKTRREITGHLIELHSLKRSLNSVDEKILEDLFIEFEYDIYRITNNYDSKISDFKFSELFNEKEKFFYYYTDTNDVSLFLNLEGSLENIYYKDNENSKNYNALLSVMGGSVRGAFLDKFGFSIRATNGIVKGDKEAASVKGNLINNFKFNEDQAGEQSTYFDETEGYLLADFDYIHFNIGRNRRTIGYGIVKDILSDNSPMMDQIGLNIKYKFVSFSWMHAKILGPENAISDSTIGALRTIADKYFVTHRLAFDFGKHLNIGFGETIIYANRSVDFSYLNPFNFYKTIEHAGKDRDNSQIYFDASNNSINGLKFYASLIFDDIDFSKLGTEWFGNQALINLSLYSSQLNQIIPIDLYFQYLRIDPYFYTHRLDYNNYTNDNIPLGAAMEPNSESFIFKLKYRPHYRIDLSFQFQYTVHGANELNDDGTIKVNHGGNILLGHRNFDSENASLLNGDNEFKRMLGFTGTYEPINNYFVRMNVNYISNSLQDIIKVDDIYSSIYMFVKF